MRPRFFSLRTSSLNGARSRPNDVARSPARTPGWAAMVSSVARVQGPEELLASRRAKRRSMSATSSTDSSSLSASVGADQVVDQMERARDTGSDASPRKSATNAAGDSYPALRASFFEILSGSTKVTRSTSMIPPGVR